MRLLLYGTRFCHLCEQAETTLRHAGMTAEYVDIAEDEALLEKYGTRIPVIQVAGSRKELDWPFDESALYQLVRQPNNN